MSPRAYLRFALGSAALLASGCTTLSGTVRGGFACRAAEGSCAPTAAIDEAATRAEPAPPASASAVGAARPAGSRTLRIVLAAYRDAAGRSHEARVVHAVLPDPPATALRSPANARDILAALGRAGEPVPPHPAILPSTNPFPPQLPGGLVPPSQADGETPGAGAPDTGVPGRPPSPGRVPHPSSPPEREP